MSFSTNCGKKASAKRMITNAVCNVCNPNLVEVEINNSTGRKPQIGILLGMAICQNELLIWHKNLK